MQVTCWAILSAQDSTRIRGALKAAGIKASVRLGKGSGSHGVWVRARDPRAVEVAEAAGYCLLRNESFPSLGHYRFGRPLWQREIRKGATS